jgi:hypothetical protein
MLYHKRSLACVLKSKGMLLQRVGTSGRETAEVMLSILKLYLRVFPHALPNGIRKSNPFSLSHSREKGQ